VIGCEANLESNTLSWCLIKPGMAADWGRRGALGDMGSCAQTENIEFTLGLTPAVTIQGMTMVANWGSVPFAHGGANLGPSGNATALQVWMNDRQARYLHSEGALTTTSSGEAAAAAAADRDSSVGPMSAAGLRARADSLFARIRQLQAEKASAPEDEKAALLHQEALLVRIRAPAVHSFP